MDAYIQSLFAMLPLAWQPYVVLFLIVAYVVTKWRSNKKSNVIAAQPQAKDLHTVGYFGKIVNFMF